MLSSTAGNIRVDNIIEVHSRHTRNGLIMFCGRVNEIVANRADCVRTDLRTKNFRRVLKIIQRANTLAQPNISLSSVDPISHSL